MTEQKQQPPQPQSHQQPPALGPYFLSVFLFALGLWCVYDGWFTTDPEMFRHMDFNRIMSVIFIPIAIFDFIRTRRFEMARKAKQAQKDDSKS
jgi:hypothetical protein